MINLHDINAGYLPHQLANMWYMQQNGYKVRIKDHKVQYYDSWIHRWGRMNGKYSYQMQGWKDAGSPDPNWKQIEII